MLTSLSTGLVGSLGGAHFACGGVYFFGSLKAGMVEVLSQLSPSHWIPSCVFSTVDSCSSLQPAERLQLSQVYFGQPNLYRHPTDKKDG